MICNDILIVDDEEGIRNLIKGILEDEGYSVRLAENAEKAYEQIEQAIPALIIQDIWLQGSHHDGLQILETVKKAHKNIPVLMISGHGTIETAVSAIKQGAYDFIEKPFKSDRLLLMIERALENAQLKRENESLRQRAEKSSVEMVGTTPLIQNIQQILEKVAPTNSRVLITGEAGTGKNMAARYIHRSSKRSEKPFVAINCATFQPERLEIEIFGSVDGILNEPAKIGALEMAHEGTLLLDEVSDLPVEIQGKIVRMLQEESYKKVGENKLTPTNVRIIASTSKNLEKIMQEGKFRQDLYYRLNVVSIQMPSLRKRSNDIPALIETLAGSIAHENGQIVKPFTHQAIQALQNYEWPGNIRQLRNVMEWVSIMAAQSDCQTYDIHHLPPEITGNTNSQSFEPSSSLFNREDLISMTLREAREVFERDYLLSQIGRFNGNVSKTAQFVGMERSALHRKLKSLDVFTSEKDQDMAEEDSQAKRASR
jgi:two-component system, NtrC family, nitrogen regulation response regulator NtrX